MTDTDHYTNNEAAGYTKLAAGTLTNKRPHGSGAVYFLKVRLRLIYTWAELEAWIECHRGPRSL